MKTGGNFDGNRLRAWLLDMLREKGVSDRSASLDAKLDHAAISRFLKGTRPSPASCKKLADYFEVPAEMVLHLAGYVSAPPNHDLFLKQVSELTRGLTAAERRQVLDVLKALRKRQAG